MSDSEGLRFPDEPFAASCVLLRRSPAGSAERVWQMSKMAIAAVLPDGSDQVGSCVF
jgi:hypothetical protein